MTPSATKTDRAKGAVIGAIVADAATMGLHWWVQGSSGTAALFVQLLMCHDMPGISSRCRVAPIQHCCFLLVPACCKCLMQLMRPLQPVDFDVASQQCRKQCHKLFLSILCCSSVVGYMTMQSCRSCWQAKGKQSPPSSSIFPAVPFTR